MTDTAARVAVLVPCRDEAATVAQVVFDFQHALPGAVVYVYDNASADDTGARAKAAGAVVRREMRPGKGTVVRRMFADIDADIYVLVDGDGTYDADAAPGSARWKSAMTWPTVADSSRHGTSTAIRAPISLIAARIPARAALPRLPRCRPVAASAARQQPVRRTR